MKSDALKFRRLNDEFAVAGQITPEEVQKVADAGFKTIVCARPDNEDASQPSFAEIAAEAERVGLSAVHIPVSGMIGEGQLIRMEEAMKTLPKPMFGYCKSGGRAGSLYGAVTR
ncbi:beta-lactamase hydrolase domain-containing protein [Devosia sp.]|uniref:beta-lactamase hydrolase domain-containing protein n=1 Tax=Devosia sp. TaxID=1871048 RepID=UPI003A8CB6B0